MKILRIILQKIERILLQNTSPKRAIILYGPRRAGKTTLVKHIISKYPHASAYFDCDFFDVQELFSYKKSHGLDMVVKGLKLLILDEAQRIENIGLILKILVDNYPNLQVIATGSSSFDLSNKISEPLTGRKIVFQLLPVSFEELHVKSTIIEKRRGLLSLLRFGSYPEIISQKQDEIINKLMEISSSYLFKDIFNFQHLKKPELLTNLLRLLAFQIGHEVSFHELARQLGADQSVIQKYIHLLEEAFVIFRLGAFRRNLRSEIAKSRKIYFCDLGIRNALIQNFNELDLRNDVGQLWENFCIAERLKVHNNHQIFVNKYFWRTYDQKEIDYIEEIGGKLYAFEFKWNTKKRIKKPQQFLDTYNNSSFEIINPENFHGFVEPETKD
jgi:predicted AAA+ superfamily ATPase